jgi:hypothetical protein
MDCGGLILGVGRDLGLLDFDTRAYGRIPDAGCSGRYASSISCRSRSPSAPPATPPSTGTGVVTLLMG